VAKRKIQVITRPTLKISIVTPSYNHAEFLPKAIESVLGQTGSFELDYVVLDGGSNDTTIDVLKSFGSRLCWHSQEDNGQIDAINKGLLSASGDLVGWLNSDDLLLPGALQRVADAFLREPSAQWVFGDCIVVDRNGQEIRKWVSAYNW
jgi:glycosyltransferase involved in cell wall biosynthesis